MPRIASQTPTAPPWGAHYNWQGVLDAMKAQCAALALPQAHQGDLDIDACMLMQHFDPEIAWVWVLRQYGTYLHPVAMTAWHTKAAACAASRTGEGPRKAFLIARDRFSEVTAADLADIYRWDYSVRDGIARRGKEAIAGVQVEERHSANGTAVAVTMRSLQLLSGRDRIGLRLLAAEANVWANRVEASLDGQALAMSTDALLATRPLEP